MVANEYQLLFSAAGLAIGACPWQAGSGFPQRDREPAAQGIGQADLVGGVQIGQRQHAFADVARVQQFAALHAGQAAAIDRRGVPMAVHAQVHVAAAAFAQLAAFVQV
ncbi:hypothetical protein G6F35_015687 [Rhizopus arrhizus]|nr:hypothetical protein G6F35_015687 [Rhizopus arrhizus]